MSDGKVLRLIRYMLEVGYQEEGKLFSSSKGTLQGSVNSPLLSNIYLTPFDNLMTQAGYRLTKYADDWLVVCRSRAEANQALRKAKEILGYTIRQGKGHSKAEHRRSSKANTMNLYAIPKEKSVEKFRNGI